MTHASSPVSARLRRRAPVFICRKCLKKAPDAGATRKALKRALKGRAREQGIKPRLIAATCFGICPKRAVVVASASTLERGEVLLVADAGMADAAAQALLGAATGDKRP